VILASVFDEWIRQSSFFGGIVVTGCLVTVLVLRQLELLGTSVHRPNRATRTVGLRRRKLTERRRGIARTAGLCAMPLLALFMLIVLARFAILA
jgi:hypothetical protein